MLEDNLVKVTSFKEHTVLDIGRADPLVSPVFVGLKSYAFVGHICNEMLHSVINTFHLLLRSWLKRNLSRAPGPHNETQGKRMSHLFRTQRPRPRFEGRMSIREHSLILNGNVTACPGLIFNALKVLTSLSVISNPPVVVKVWPNNSSCSRIPHFRYSKYWSESNLSVVPIFPLQLAKKSLLRNHFPLKISS